MRSGRGVIPGAVPPVLLCPGRWGGFAGLGEGEQALVAGGDQARSKASVAVGAGFVGGRE